MTKNRPDNRIWAAFALLALCLWMAGGLQAADVKPAEEARLFSLSDLGPVDFAAKTVKVEIYAAPAPELQPFISMLPLVWSQVQQFYARMGVNVVQVQGEARPGLLVPAEQVRLEALPYKEWLARSFKAFDLAPPFRLSFLAVCKNKYAFAHLPLSVIHFSYKRFQEAVFDDKPGAARQNLRTLANLIIHELGHLMGLCHAHEFMNDPIEEMLPDGKTPNFMSHHLTHEGGLGFVPFQKQLIHSYLGKGKIFQQYKQVEFDPVRYLELLKQHNGFTEAARDCKKEEF
jgi:hypothetical protein